MTSHNSHGQYGPTDSGKYYRPLYYHGVKAKANPNKTRWVINSAEEYLLFKDADDSHWNCNDNKGLFGIRDMGRTTLGENGECLAFFPNVINTKDAWHGWPSPSNERCPSEQLLKEWVDNKVIDERARIKILKGQL